MARVKTAGANLEAGAEQSAPAEYPADGKVDLEGQTYTYGGAFYGPGVVTFAVNHDNPDIARQAQEAATNLAARHKANVDAGVFLPPDKQPTQKFGQTTVSSLVVVEKPAEEGQTQEPEAPANPEGANVDPNAQQPE